MKPIIIIVQNTPTQFDVPLYQLIAQEEPFQLIVYYTQTHLSKTLNAKFDLEIGRSPLWDHLENANYDRRDLTTTEAKNAQLVAQKIIADQPDLVILSGYYPRLHAKLAIILRLKGICIGLRSDNTIPHSELSGMKGLLKKAFLRYWLRIYDSWHPVGTLAREYLETISGTRKPTFYFPYNVNNDWFSEVSSTDYSQRNELRQSCGIPSNAYVILGIMKWHPREDPLTLVDAYSKLYECEENICLLFVGDGPLKEEVYSKVLTLGNSVVLPGYVPYSELPRLYALSDVFVHPAINEPWGVSVNEAMACGLPVITSDGVGSRIDLVEEGKTGFTFPNGDSEKLSKLLLQFLQDRPLCHQLGEQAKQKITNWSYTQTITEMLRAIENL